MDTCPIYDVDAAMHEVVEMTARVDARLAAEASSKKVLGPLLVEESQVPQHADAGKAFLKLPGVEDSKDSQALDCMGPLQVPQQQSRKVPQHKQDSTIPQKLSHSQVPEEVERAQDSAPAECSQDPQVLGEPPHSEVAEEAKHPPDSQVPAPAEHSQDSHVPQEPCHSQVPQEVERAQDSQVPPAAEHSQDALVPQK